MRESAYDADTRATLRNWIINVLLVALGAMLLAGAAAVRIAGQRAVDQATSSAAK